MFSFAFKILIFVLPVTKVNNILQLILNSSPSTGLVLQQLCIRYIGDTILYQFWKIYFNNGLTNVEKEKKMNTIGRKHSKIIEKTCQIISMIHFSKIFCQCKTFIITSQLASKWSMKYIQVKYI